MANDVFSFLWTVPDSGHQWIQARLINNDQDPSAVSNRSTLDEKVQWILTDGLTYGQPYRMTRYNPLKTTPGLFRNFAQIQPTDRDAILAFANKYGQLGDKRPLHLGDPKEPISPFTTRGETHDSWMDHIVAMQRGVTIWEALNRRDLATLSSFICWQAEERTPDGANVTRVAGWHYDSHPELPPFPKKGSAPPAPGRLRQLIEPVPDLFKTDEVFMPATFLVQRWINEHLKKNAAPRLLYNLDLGSQVVNIVPHNLIGAMWLQFAEAIAGNKHHRPCKECGTWFEISTEEDGRTARRVFCSDACKSRDYRGRKDQAERLKGEGKTLKDIAKELDTDTETVKNWLNNRKSR